MHYIYKARIMCSRQKIQFQRYVRFGIKKKHRKKWILWLPDPLSVHNILMNIKYNINFQPRIQRIFGERKSTLEEKILYLVVADVDFSIFCPLARKQWDNISLLSCRRFLSLVFFYLWDKKLQDQEKNPAILYTLSFEWQNIYQTYHISLT